MRSSKAWAFRFSSTLQRTAARHREIPAAVTAGSLSVPLGHVQPDRLGSAQQSILRVPMALQFLAGPVRPAAVLDRRALHVQLLLSEGHTLPFDPDTDPDPDPECNPARKQAAPKSKSPTTHKKVRSNRMNPKNDHPFTFGKEAVIGLTGSNRMNRKNYSLTFLVAGRFLKIEKGYVLRAGKVCPKFY
jgi:hypothetical protein